MTVGNTRSSFGISILLSIIAVLFAASNTTAQLNTQPTDPKRESPRATLRTFLHAFEQPRVGVTPDPLEEAIKCIDLDAIPPDYRPARGFEVAAELYEVIHTIENFQPDDAPAETKGDPYHLFRSQHGEIVLTRHPNGEWLFAQETVRVAPLLVTDIEEERRELGTAILTQNDSLGSQIRERMPPVLKPRTLGLERWQWFGLLVLALLGLLAWQAVRLAASLILGHILKGRFGGIADEQIKLLYHPFGLIGFVITFRLGLRALALTQGALAGLRTMMFVLTSVAVIWLTYRIVDIVILRLRKRAIGTESQSDDLLVPFVGAIARFAIVVIGAIVVAENLDFNVTGLIAGLGIGGIAIALASQETLSNFFGSLVLLIEQPFKAEDRVEVDGVTGTVKKVGFRSTQILTYDDSVVTVPNSNIAKSNVTNDGLRRHRRWVMKLSIPYTNGPTKIDQLCKGIEKIIDRTDSLNTDAYRLHLFDVVAPSLILRIEVNFTQDDYDFELAARHQFILDLLKLAADLDIELKVAA